MCVCVCVCCVCVCVCLSVCLCVCVCAIAQTIKSAVVESTRRVNHFVYSIERITCYILFLPLTTTCGYTFGYGERGTYSRDCRGMWGCRVGR